MTEEEKKAIDIVEDIAFIRGIRQDVDGKIEDLKAIKDVFRLVDNKQKEIELYIENNAKIKELNEEEKKAIDILMNEIADIVVGEYCTHCKICENGNTECYYIKAIDTVYNLIDKQQKEIEELKQITSLYNSYEVADEERRIVIADTEYFAKGYFKKNFISKDRIREKIKKYEKLDKEEYAKQGNFETEISLLKELLEEK